MSIWRSMAGGAILITLLCCPSYGWDALSTDEMEFHLAPYLWMAGIDGDVAAKGVESSIDADFGDIWDHLDVGAQAYVEASGVFLWTPCTGSVR